MSASVLDAVVAGARRSAELRERAIARDAFERTWAARKPRGDQFEAALRQPGVRIIAECKRRSPAKGVLRQKYDPGTIGRSYESGGAAAISVLTEPTFFDGSLERYVIDAGALAGKYGKVVVSIFPGRSGLRDDAAVVAGRLVRVI